MDHITAFLTKYPHFTLRTSSLEDGAWRVALRFGLVELTAEDADLDEAIDDLGYRVALEL